MKIVVCIKQVPDTEAEVKWDLPKGTIKREGMDSITNPFDEFALEEALLTKEKYDGEIVAITMGPDKAIGRAAKRPGAGRGSGLSYQ